MPDDDTAGAVGRALTLRAPNDFLKQDAVRFERVYLDQAA